MAGLPTLQVRLDDGTGTFPFDITSKVRMSSGWSASRGRQDEQADVQAGALDLTLDNSDGRFTHGSTVLASPSPIKVDQRIRVIETANATTSTRFTGYVQSWPVQWPGGQSLVLAQIRAVDVLARAERRELLSVIEEETLTLAPDLLFLMNEPEGATAASDSAGRIVPAPRLAPGSGETAPTFGSATGPGTDGHTAAVFAAAADAIEARISGILNTGTFCASLFLSSPSGGSLLWGQRILEAAAGSSFAYLFWDTTGAIAYEMTGMGAPVIGVTNVANGATHHVALIYEGGQSKIVVNGVVEATFDRAPYSANMIPRLRLNPALNGTSVTLAHVAVWYGIRASGTSVLSSTASAARISQSGLTGFAGETAGARIAGLAGYLPALPTGTIEAGTAVAFSDITGRSQADAIRDVAAADLGIVDIDGDGGLDYTTRNTIALKAAPDLTFPASWLEQDLQPVVDNQQIVNFFDASNVDGVSARVRYTPSEDAHGRYSESKQYLLADLEAARNRGEWIVNNYAEPTMRVGSLAIDVLTRTAAEQAQLLALKPGAWIRVTGLPSQMPGGTTADLVIQGLTESQSTSAWTLTCNVVSRSLYQAWLLGNASYGVLGSTTRLYV